jgi:SAM-dependent methyltransferase
MQDFYPETAYGGFSRADGTVAFYTRVNALIDPPSTILDVGCGRGEYAEDPVENRRRLRNLRGKVAKVIGIDPDPAAETNPCVDTFRLVDGPRWPVDDAAVDLCLVDNVLEHADEPDDLLRECRRVLLPGGRLCIRTPNAFGYSTVLARLIPNAVHAAILGRVQIGRRSIDVFPTHYRCNTPRQLRESLARTGFTASVYGHGAEPSYLEFSRIAYALGVAWSYALPPSLQNTLFAFATRR